MVTFLSCEARGPGFPVSPLRIQGLVISCFQVATWLKDRKSDENLQNYQQPSNIIFYPLPLPIILAMKLAFSVLHYDLLSSKMEMLQ